MKETNVNEKLNNSPKEPLIRVRDLLIEFGFGRKRNKAVKGVSFDVYKGETFGLVGESGSGKTTVARAIMGMQPIADGTIYFENKIARGKEPDLFKLSKAINKNVTALIDNQNSTTLRIKKFVNEYKRIFYKYSESKFYDFKTGETREYEDGISRKILEGTNLKDSKIVTADKENIFKELSVLAQDNLKRMVKIVRILQKTIKFSDHLSNFIDLEVELDDRVTFYLEIIQEKILKIKKYQNKMYLALKEIEAIRLGTLAGDYTSVKKFFNYFGFNLESIVQAHKKLGEVANSMLNDIFFLECLVSPKNKRSYYFKMIAQLQTDFANEPKIVSECELNLQLMKMKNINEAIDDSTTFAPVYKKEKKTLKREMQMIFQDPSSSLNDHMSVEEIIAEGISNFSYLYKNETVYQEYLEWFNSDKSEENRITLKDVKPAKVKNYLILKQLESVGLLAEHLSRYPHEFSGGQRQRIGIARSLIMKPKFIVADEPISALDVSIRAQVLNLMNEFKEKDDLTYIFIAHDLSVVRHIADRIAVIYRGDIVELAAAEELFNNPLHPYTKSLLMAIPLADPDQEREKVYLNYDPVVEHPDYLVDFPMWNEVTTDHYVYCNNRELENYQEIIKKSTPAKTKKRTTTPRKKTTTSKEETKVASSPKKRTTKSRVQVGEN